MALLGTSRRPSYALFLATLLGCTAMSGVARGQTAPVTPVAAPAKVPPSAADKAKAADLFKKSVDAYRQGDFQHAIELLDEAYALDPQPVLVYNRARAAEGLGHLDAAISGYEKFLVEEPKTRDRGAIEQRVVTLKRQRDERAQLEKERDARRDEVVPVPVPAEEPKQPPREDVAPAAPPEPPPKATSPLPYVVAGVGAAGLLTGALFGVLAISKNSDAESERVQEKAIDTKSSADGLATVSTVSFIVGGILVVAGATWWAIDHGVFKKGRASHVMPKWTTGLGGTF